MIDNVDDVKKGNWLNIVCIVLGFLILGILIIIIGLFSKGDVTINSPLSHKEEIINYNVYSDNNDIFIKCTTSSNIYIFSISSENIKGVSKESGFILNETYLYLSSDDIKDINKQLESYNMYLITENN